MFNVVTQLLKIHFQAMIASMFSFMSGKRSMNKPDKSVSGIVITVLLIFLIVVMLVFFFSMFVIVSAILAMGGLPNFYFSVVFISSAVFSLMGSIFASQSYLFDAQDNELLVSMPIKPSIILLSRISTLYILNFFYCSIITIPALLAYGIVIRFSIIGFLFYFISMLLIPLLVTALCCIIGYIIWFISSKMPKKNIGSGIFGFIVLAIVISIGFAINSLGNIISGDKYTFYSTLTSIEYDVHKYFPPAMWYSHAVYTSDIVYMSLFLLTCIIPMILAFVFISFKFRKIVTTKSLYKKKQFVAKKLNKSSVLTALLRKELKNFFSIQGYIMNCGIGTLISIILGVFTALNGNSITQTFSKTLENADALFPLSFACALVVTSVMNDVTAPSISLEAKTLWILKSAPIKPMDVFISKALISPIITLPGIIIATICYIFGRGINLIDILFIFIMPLLATTFSGVLGVLINLRFPRFDWSSQIIVIKQSGSVIISLFASVLISAFPFIFAISLPVLIKDYNMMISYAICFFYMLLALITTFILLKVHGNRLYNKL